MAVDRVLWGVLRRDSTKPVPSSIARNETSAIEGLHPESDSVMHYRRSPARRKPGLAVRGMLMHSQAKKCISKVYRLLSKRDSSDSDCETAVRPLPVFFQHRCSCPNHIHHLRDSIGVWYGTGYLHGGFYKHQSSVTLHCKLHIHYTASLRAAKMRHLPSRSQPPKAETENKSFEIQSSASAVWLLELQHVREIAEDSPNTTPIHHVTTHHIAQSFRTKA